jgi:hypothetical protein
MLASLVHNRAGEKMPLAKTAPAAIHLYHATKLPIIVHTEADKRAAMFLTAKAAKELGGGAKEGDPTGYSETYVPQEYPKEVSGKFAANAAEEKKILEAV